MSTNLDIFRTYFLQPPSWELRKDGAPLYLLDSLSEEERKTAEAELIPAAYSGDSWPVLALGHLRSTRSLPALYEILPQARKGMKVVVAHSIFQVCQDPDMIGVVLKEVPRIKTESELIDIVYLLPQFNDKSVNQLLDQLRAHSDYLVAYNATRAMGLDTEEVVPKFRGRKNRQVFGRGFLGKKDAISPGSLSY